MFYVYKNGIEHLRCGCALIALFHVQVTGANEHAKEPHEYTVAQAIADGWEITTQPRQ
jgi:hypothetical protein